MRLKNLLEKKSGSNVAEATIQLHKSLQIPVTATTAIERVESHPDFPSLYSISDSLDSWKVENAAFAVETESLDKLPMPFIAHIRKSGGQFILVKSINGTVDIINEKGKEEKLSRESFLMDWTNNVLLAEKNDHSGENDYQKQRKKEVVAGLRLPALIGTGLLLVFLFTFANIGRATGLTASALLFAKLSGVIITGLLLWFEVDKAAPVVQQICGGGRNTNCLAVLNSKGSKLFTWLNWSEAGFFYFAGTFLALTLTSYLPFFAWLNLLALPYTVFSVYYQWRIAKQWCPLCLAVQAVLVAEAGINYVGYWSAATYQPIYLSTALFLPLLTSFLLPVLFWATTKKVFLSAQTGRQYKTELNKLRYNKEIFTALLKKQKSVTVSTEGLGITLGNPGAKHTLVKVCNPYCGPCAKAHKAIDELLETNNDLKVQIIFTASNKEADIKAPPVKHLVAISEQGDDVLMQKALADWYGAAKKDYEAFKAKYPVNKELNFHSKELEAMDAWCKKTGISFTPTIFINGYQLPEVYKLEDLKYLL